MRISPGALAEARITDGTNFAAILAAAATQDETLVQYLATLTAMYAFNGTEMARLRSVIPADTLANSITSLVMHSRASRFNGATWDRERNNEEITVLASAARTATIASDDQANFNNVGLFLFLDVTAASGTSPTIQPAIQMKDPVSDTYLMTHNTAQETGVTFVISIDYPGASETSAVANVNPQAYPIGRTWRVNTVIGGTTPNFTFSLGASMVG